MLTREPIDPLMWFLFTRWDGPHPLREQSRETWLCSSCTQAGTMAMAGGGLWRAVSDQRTDEGVVEDTGPDLLFPTFGSWNWNACSLCLVPYSWDQDYVTTCPKHPGSWEQEDISEADREGARDRHSGWRITILWQGTHPKKAPSGPLKLPASMGGLLDHEAGLYLVLTALVFHSRSWGNRKALKAQVEMLKTIEQLTYFFLMKLKEQRIPANREVNVNKSPFFSLPNYYSWLRACL